MFVSPCITSIICHIRKTLSQVPAVPNSTNHQIQRTACESVLFDIFVLSPGRDTGCSIKYSNKAIPTFFHTSKSASIYTKGFETLSSSSQSTICLCASLGVSQILSWKPHRPSLGCRKLHVFIHSLQIFYVYCEFYGIYKYACFCDLLALRPKKKSKAIRTTYFGDGVLGAAGCSSLFFYEKKRNKKHHTHKSNVKQTSAYVPNQHQG